MLSMYVCMLGPLEVLSMYVCMLEPLEVPPLTNLEKLNKTFNTEGFPWGIGPSPGMMIYGLKHTYMLGDIHTCLDTSDIHTCSQVSDIHTRLAISKRWLSVYVWACMFHFPWQAEGFQTYTLTQTCIFWFFMMIKRVCLSVYVSLSMTGRWFSNIHTCSAHIFIFWNMRFWACMFERVCLIFDDRQSVFKHTYMLIWLIVDSILANFAQACMYVWGLWKYPPHKSQKIALSFKYWTFFVRNRTHLLGR